MKPTTAPRLLTARPRPGLIKTPSASTGPRTRKARPLALALTALLILTTVPARAQAPLKMACVDMQELFKQYHPTNEAQKHINIERAKMQKENNARLARMRELETELKALRGQLENPTISDNNKKELFEEFQAKTQEGVTLDRERREFLERRNKALNEKMVALMRGILQEIRNTVEIRAKADGYNYVVDKSGMSTSQVPFLIYSDIDDLTPALLIEINKDAPAGDGKPKTPPPTPEPGE